MISIDGGPAFPSVNDVQVGDFGTAGHSGMSLRDWFAGQALAGAMSHPDVKVPGRLVEARALVTLATEVYAIADAMLAAREQSRGDV